MNRFSNYQLLVLALAASASAAVLPADWQNEQHFDVPAPGLTKLSLPIETLDKARPALEDLRLYDATGSEVPFLIEHPLPANKITQTAKSFQFSLNPTTTIIIVETGLPQPMDALTLETPASSFIKSVQIEGSADGKVWQALTQGQSIFRQRGGASQLRLAFGAGLWPWLRLTVDDRRAEPIPFSGARVHAAAVEVVPSEAVTVSISERHESPGETRLTLNLGAANLHIATLQIETAEPLFTREVTLAVSQIAEDSIREQPVGQGTIYRLASEGQPPSGTTTLTLENQVRSRELLLLIKNMDSPPLPIAAVRAERRPVYLVFFARQAGAYRLLTGNNRCPVPRYDLAAMGANLKTAVVLPARVSAVSGNPSYRPPDVLPGVQEEGAALDVSLWRFRKAVKAARPGTQQLELDLDVLSRAESAFQDLRLMRAGKQLPYILDRTSISRALVPVVTAVKDAKDPKLSRWGLKLSRPALPITRLTCRARTPLFQRNLALWEEITDERGQKFRRSLGQALWIQTPGSTNKEFSLLVDAPLQTDTLFLETPNGDNSPIMLENLQVFYPATRVLFKAKPEDEIFLLYGNSRATAPRYDLSLVASELLTADKTPASLAPEEPLKKSWRSEGQTPGKGGLLLWGSLALVVVVLLVLISRLLPKSSNPSS